MSQFHLPTHGQLYSKHIYPWTWSSDQDSPVKHCWFKQDAEEQTRSKSLSTQRQSSNVPCTLLAPTYVPHTVMKKWIPPQFLLPFTFPTANTLYFNPIFLEHNCPAHNVASPQLYVLTKMKKEDSAQACLQLKSLFLLFIPFPTIRVIL